jgi:hypothetical protein
MNLQISRSVGFQDFELHEGQLNGFSFWGLFLVHL